METPIINLNEDELKSVYEPSEDTFLLIDALELDLNGILKCKKPSICLEIGIGSGIVLTALAMALKEYCCSYFLGIDINPYACKATKKTCIRNKINIEIIQMDLLSNIDHKNIFDIIIFNPPYVVTDPLEIIGNESISKTWAGGYKGRQVMDKIFPLIPKLLSQEGLFYLLVIKENEPDDIIQIFQNINMTGVLVVERKIRGEHLYVLRFKKNMVKQYSN